MSSSLKLKFSKEDMLKAKQQIEQLSEDSTLNSTEKHKESYIRRVMTSAAEDDEKQPSASESSSSESSGYSSSDSSSSMLSISSDSDSEQPQARDESDSSPLSPSSSSFPLRSLPIEAKISRSTKTFPKRGKEPVPHKHGKENTHSQNHHHHHHHHHHHRRHSRNSSEVVDSPAVKGSQQPTSMHDAQKDAVEWRLDCVCGIKGDNYDDGSAMIACDDCEVWQHMVCVGFSPTGIAPEHFSCHNCKSKLDSSTTSLRPNDTRVPVPEDGGEEWTVHCSCGIVQRNYDDGKRMIACDECSNWQHTMCVGILPECDPPAQYRCPVCLEKEKLREEEQKQRKEKERLERKLELERKRQHQQQQDREWKLGLERHRGIDLHRVQDFSCSEDDHEELESDEWSSEGEDDVDVEICPTPTPTPTPVKLPAISVRGVVSIANKSTKLRKAVATPTTTSAIPTAPVVKSAGDIKSGGSLALPVKSFGRSCGSKRAKPKTVRERLKKKLLR